MDIVFNNLKCFGNSVSPAQLNALVDALQSVALCNGVGYRVSRNAAGTVLQATNGNSLIAACPFDLTVKEGIGDKIARVRAGSVNQLLPDNIFDDFHFNPSDVIKVKVRATSDGQKITGATLIFDTAEATAQTPTPFALPATVDILISVIVAGKPYRIIDCGSIDLIGLEQFRIDKDPPAEAGELAYTPFYTWVPQ